VTNSFFFIGDVVFLCRYMAQNGSTGIHIRGSAVFFVMVNSDRVGNWGILLEVIQEPFKNNSNTSSLCLDGDRSS
jgi:hypothetical protein